MEYAITEQPGIIMITCVCTVTTVLSRCMRSKATPPGDVMDMVKDADFLKIRQKVDLLEVITGFEVKNRYEVVDAQDRCLLYVREESNTCQRLFCAPVHTLSLHVTDVAGKEVARMHREFQCCAGCCWCANSDRCSFQFWIDSPTGQNIAHIKQSLTFGNNGQGKDWCAQCPDNVTEWDAMFCVRGIVFRGFCCNPKIQILDGYGKEMFQVTGPCCCFCQGPGCTDDLEFPVYMNGEVVAKVTKIWDGVARGCCTNANTFGLHFLRKNLDLNKKLAIFGCAFELDYLFFENQGEGQ